MMRADDDIPGWLRRAIREEAGRYAPDRAYMHAQVRAATVPRRWPSRLRPAGAALSVSVAVAVAVTAIWQGLAIRRPAPAKPVAESSAPALSATHVSPSLSAAASQMATAGSPVPPARETASVVPAAPGADRFLRCTAALGPGTGPYWTQESVTVTNDRRLSSLWVTIRVARAWNIDPKGFFVTPPQRDVTVSVREWNGTLSYQFILRRGETLPRGRWTFTVQYRHPSGRHDRSLDTYAVSATAVGGADARLHGHF